jgi:hypothetical protein
LVLPRIKNWCTVGTTTIKTSKPTGAGFPRLDHQRPGLLSRLLPKAVAVLLLVEKRLFAFPITYSELDFVFSLPRLQVQNFLVETVPLSFGPSLAQLQFELKDGFE